MRIEAVTVCINYADFLEQAIPHNLPHLDRWVIVTTPNDGRTIGLCKKWSISHVETNVLDEHPEDKFNKGRAINVGLSHLRQGDWLLHLDADTVLPERCKDMLTRARLDPVCLYGADRVDCKSPDLWQNHQATAPPQWRHHYLLTPPQMPLSARLVHWDHGYCPIGYFQLWHSSQQKIYPATTGTSEHSDVMFAIQWPRAKRVLLPEVVCVHLSTADNMGANWKGRTSKQWSRPGVCRHCHHQPCCCHHHPYCPPTHHH
jgi:hypothetical protein